MKLTKDEEKTFAYIGQHLFNHAFCCEDVWCVCHASTFMDAICDLADNSPRYKREVNELLQRKETVQLVTQNQKLRALANDEFQLYDEAFRKHKDIDDFKIAQVLQKILRRSKE